MIIHEIQPIKYVFQHETYLFRFAAEVLFYAVLPDEFDAIRETMLDLCCATKNAVDIIISTGGTGFSKRDVTPEVKCIHFIERTMKINHLSYGR